MRSAVLRKAPAGLEGYPEASVFLQADWRNVRILGAGTSKSVDPPEFAALGIGKEGVSVKQKSFWEMYTEDVTGARFYTLDEAERARCRTCTNSEGEAQGSRGGSFRQELYQRGRYFRLGGAGYRIELPETQEGSFACEGRSRGTLLR